MIRPRRVLVEVDQVPVTLKAKAKGKKRVRKEILHPAQGDLVAEKAPREGDLTVALLATKGQLLPPTGNLSAAPLPVGKRIANLVLST